MDLSPHRIYTVNEWVIIKEKFCNNLSERLNVRLKKVKTCNISVWTVWQLQTFDDC